MHSFISHGEVTANVQNVKTEPGDQEEEKNFTGLVAITSKNKSGILLIMSGPQNYKIGWTASHERGLMATIAIDEGTTILEEYSFVKSGVVSTDPEHYNNRPCWSLVDMAMEKRKEISHHLGNLKANRGMLRDWDEGDDIVLDRLATKWASSKSEIKHLYVLVATNNIATRSMQTKRNDSNGRIIVYNEGVSFGLFSVFSTINHSCVPNARWEVSLQSQHPVKLKALKSIAVGEAITVAYIQYQGGSVPLYDALYENFGFVCKCILCASNCRKCGQPNATKQCPCLTARYCGIECYRMDWKFHKQGALHMENYTKPRNKIC
jgi:hypothetical protein